MEASGLPHVHVHMCAQTHTWTHMQFVRLSCFSLIHKLENGQTSSLAIIPTPHPTPWCHRPLFLSGPTRCNSELGVALETQPPLRSPLGASTGSAAGAQLPQGPAWGARPSLSRQRRDSPVLLSPKSSGQEMVKDSTQTMAIMTVTRRLEL